MELRGSFIGFTFGNRHSSKMGIFRTSQSNRYSIPLKPYSKEFSAASQNQNLTFYFGQENTKQEIPISFAFYGLSEEQLAQLKTLFCDKGLKPLILDEEPYKVWLAKIANTAICKHVCFENDGARFYSGEGAITFVSYSPYAHSRYEYIEDYTMENIREWIDESAWLSNENGGPVIYPAILTYGYDSSADTGTVIGLEEDFQQWLDDLDLLTDTFGGTLNVSSCIDFFMGNGAYFNLEEWREASQIPSRPPYGLYDTVTGTYRLYNAGDIPIPFKLYLSQDQVSNEFVISISETDTIRVAGCSLQEGDSALIYDSQTRLLRGCDVNRKTTGTIYNQYIITGGFFELPLGEVLLQAPQGELEFKYLYL